MRNIMFLIFFISSFRYNSYAQKISKEYFIGKWQSVDSTTGVKEKVLFKRNNVVYFDHPSRKWNYTIQDQDSVVTINYNIHYPKAVILQEGKLIIKNDTCFWWFATVDYAQYSRAIRNGDNISRRKEFDAWLKDRREVFYKLNPQ